MTQTEKAEKELARAASSVSHWSSEVLRIEAMAKTARARLEDAIRREEAARLALGQILDLEIAEAEAALR